MATEMDVGQEITFEIADETGTQFILDSEGRQVQVMDMMSEEQSAADISQEVEVVTQMEVPTSSSRSSTRRIAGPPQRFRNNNAMNMQNYRPGKSAPPALLRNSRRLQAQYADVSPTVPLGKASTSVAATSSSSSSNALLPTPGGKTRRVQSKQAFSSQNNVNPTTRDLHEAVLLDEHGQLTDEVVILAPNELGEYTIVERSSKTMDGTDDDASNYQQQQQQTLIICQDDGEQNPFQQLMEDEDGNLIPIDQTHTNNASFELEEGETQTIYLEESATYAYDPNSNSYFITESSSTPTPTTRPKPRRKSTKKLQVVIGPDGNPVKRKGQTELKCMEKGCFMTCYNVAELRKHLTMSHGFTFDEEIVLFNSDKDFKTWRETYERERMVSFIYRGGTKKVAKDQAVTYLICHRSGHYKPTMNNETLRKRKLKPQGSCKMGGYCTAGIKLMKNVETGIVKMEICHTHYGHPLDSHAIPHLRLTPALRKVILTKFKAGLSFTEVLAYIHHNPDRLEGLRLIDRRAVRNIYDTWKHPTRRSKQAQKDIDELEESDDIIPTTTNLTADNDAEQNNDGQEQQQESNNSNNNNNNIQYILSDVINPDEDHEVILKEPPTTKKRKMLPKSSKQPKKAKQMLSHPDPVSVEEEDDDECPFGPPTLVPVVISPSPQIESSRSLRSEKKMKKEFPPPPSLEIVASPPPTTHQPAETSKSSYGLRPKRKVQVYNKKQTRKVNKSTSKNTIISSSQSEDTEEEEEEHDKNNSTNNLLDDEEEEEDYQPKSKQPKKKTKTIINKPQRKKTLSKPNLKRRVKIEIVSDISDYDEDEEFDDENPRIPPPMIISENLEQSIDKLLDHGDSGPTVLLYKPLGSSSVKYGQVDSKRELQVEDFCVVLQTPVQRQLFQMFPNILGFDFIEATKASQLNHLKLAFLMVLDEFREPIPIAWLLTNSVDSRILSSFFKSLKRQCGDLLDVKYIMTPRCSDAFKTWCTVFSTNTTDTASKSQSSKPLSILNDVEVRRDLKNLVWNEFSTDKGRREVYEVVESLILERQVDIKLNPTYLEDVLFEPLLDKLPHTGEFIEKLNKEWLSRTEEWNLHYRIGANVNIMGASTAFTRLKKFIHFKGTKNLDENFEQILKIGYDKCFLRSKRMFKGDQKFSRFLDKIADYHLKSRKLFSQVSITAGDGNFSSSESHPSSEDSTTTTTTTVIPPPPTTTTWIVSLNNEKKKTTEESNNIKYNVSLVSRPCECKLICRHCKVCQHAYTCSCSEHLISNTMCEHIHLVHCHRNNIEDEPEFITGDISTAHHNNHNNMDSSGGDFSSNNMDSSAFGRLETLVGGTSENPTSTTTSINIEAVLKAAGLFHRADGLQPDQIVSITDADTQAIIYEVNPMSSTTSSGGHDTIQLAIHGDDEETEQLIGEEEEYEHEEEDD